MAGEAASFGELLRKLRDAAGFTQEELAHTAGLSTRSVSDLERGINRTARRDTARLLAEALQLTGTARAAFEAAARGRAEADGFAVAGMPRAVRTLPRDVASFAGRESELGRLTEAVPDGEMSIHAIGGMPGIGKTALAVHAAHRLAPRFPDGQIFLPLHGHTPGQRPVEPLGALADLLLMAGVAAPQIPPGLDARIALWRDQLASRQLLLLLDDAVDSEQVRPLLPGGPGNLVLITSRRHLTALEETNAISLDTLPAADAVALLARLARRPDLAGRESALEEIARLAGYLPLALGMLARQLHHHPAWTPADLAAELATAKDRLRLMTVEDLSVAAAFDLSYADLALAEQRLLRRLGVHPGTDIDAYAAAALDGTDTASRSLAVLYEHYLLAEPARGRYRLHDLIREHARALAAVDSAADGEAAVRRVLGFYAHTARAADNRRAMRTSIVAPDPADTFLGDFPDLASWDEKTAWLEAERSNLDAAVHYAVAHDMPVPVITISDAMHVFLKDHGHLEQAGSIHRLAVQLASRAGDHAGQASALTSLAVIQSITGDRPAAIVSLNQALELCEIHGDGLGEADVLSRLGNLQYHMDDHQPAERNLRRARDLYADLGDTQGEARCLRFLGSQQRAVGQMDAAAASLTRALELHHALGDLSGEAWAHLLLGAVQRQTGDFPAASTSFSRAQELAVRLGDRILQADSLNELGSLRWETGDYPAAATSHQRALELSLALGHRLGQANALNLLGMAQSATGDYEAAARNEKEALDLYRDLEDQEGSAEVLNNLGDIALATGSPVPARAYYEQARTAAISVPLPQEEARALAGIGRSHLSEGERDPAEVALRQALKIYLGIRSPRARAVEAALREAAGLP